MAICASIRGRHEPASRSQSALVGRAVVGQRGQGGPDLVEGQPDLLGDPDERHPAERLPGVAALATLRSGWSG